MKIVQRIVSAVNGEKMDNLIERRKKHEGAFDEVWLTTETGFPTLERHRAVAKEYASAAEKLRDAGIEVSVELLSTIGHGQYKMIRDNSGLVYDGSPVKDIVGHDGTTCHYAFCWWGEFVRKYITETVKIYLSEIKPHALWIDDDFRAWNHDPVSFGCYCDDCIKRFNEKHSYSYSRETLVEEFLHGKINVRAEYIEFIREGLASLMTEICEAAKAASPDTRIGLENGPNGPYTGRGHDYIFDAILKTTGRAPMFRPGAGAYVDHDPNELVEKVYNLAYQSSLLPDYVKDIYPEIENIPHSAMGKTMHGTILEAAMNLANGATDLSFAMLGEHNEPIEFYEGGFKLFSEQRSYLDRLSDVSKRSRAGGVCYALSKEAHLREMKPSEDIFDFNNEEFMDGVPLVRLGIPLSFTDSDVYILHPKAARQMTDRELIALMSKKVITDAEAVEHMLKRGIDIGFEIREASVTEQLVMRDEYTDSQINRGYYNSNFAAIFSRGYGNSRFITKIPDSALVLGKYQPHHLLPRLTDDPEAPHGYSAVIADTKTGGKIAVMACGLWKLTCHSTQRDRILNVIDFLGYVPARLLTPNQAVIMPRVDDDGKTLCVSVTNCTVGYPDGIKIKIRNPRAKKFQFVSQYSGVRELEYEECDGEFTVTLPTLAPWSIGTVFCDE
ncbi:MAG: hypothetical protein IJX92_01045 [Clostridia bacterium]|nr:hypothetical protein [Clostridia bacterium]